MLLNFYVRYAPMSGERKLYGQLVSVLKEGGNGEVAELYGDGGRPYVVSKGSGGAIVVSGGGQENIVIPDGEQIVVNNS